MACGRCEKTFTNYLGYARVGCFLVGAPDEVFNSRALQRAKCAIAKRQSFIPRRRFFLRQSLLQRLLRFGAAKLQWKETIMWMLTAYAFLLRHGSHSLQW